MVTHDFYNFAELFFMLNILLEQLIIGAFGILIKSWDEVEETRNHEYRVAQTKLYGISQYYTCTVQEYCACTRINNDKITKMSTI